MNLKEYNVIQVKLIERYKLECLCVNEKVAFCKLCAAMSAYREKKCCYSVVKGMIEEVRKYIDIEKI